MTRSDPSLPEPADYAGTAPAPFTLVASAACSVPVVIAVPHAGRDYSTALLAAMRDPKETPARLEDRHADILGREVAAQTGAALLLAHAPRALIDLNRAPDDIDWSMVTGSPPRRAQHSAANRRARSGLGLVPRRLPGSGEIWRHRLGEAELSERIASVHRPYHEALAAVLESIRDRWGAALLVDLHSMPPLPATAGGVGATEFVVGDRFGASCNSGLIGRSLQHFAAAGRRVAHNRPYSGGYALDRHAIPRRGIHALQIEVCRASYLDAGLDRPSPRLPSVVRLLAGLIRALADDVAVLGQSGTLREAAE